MPRSKTAAEIIAIHFCSDIGDIKEGRYQRYERPAVYVVGNDYYAAHETKPRHDVAQSWELVPNQIDWDDTKKRIWVSRATRAI